jgi:lambda family phage minor tail protein L
MRSVNSTFKSEKNKQENQPIRLYTLENYNGSGSNLNFAEYDTDIVFNGITYTRFPISIDMISENNKSVIDMVNLTVSNVSRIIQSYLESYDLRGKKISIKTVWANQLADANAYIEDVFYIDSYTADQNNVSFVLTTKFDVLDVELPLRKYSRNYCNWKFKGTECGYAGADTVCNKTKQDCKNNKHNYARFGGFPSIQSNRILLG